MLHTHNTCTETHTNTCSRQQRVTTCLVAFVPHLYAVFPAIVLLTSPHANTSLWKKWVRKKEKKRKGHSRFILNWIIQSALYGATCQCVWARQITAVLHRRETSKCDYVAAYQDSGSICVVMVTLMLAWIPYTGYTLTQSDLSISVDSNSIMVIFRRFLQAMCHLKNWTQLDLWVTWGCCSSRAFSIIYKSYILILDKCT